MTNGKTMIGFYGGSCYGCIKDSSGNHLIAIAQKKRRIVTDLLFIASNIYLFLDYVVEQLESGNPLTFPEDVDFRRSRDKELDQLYAHNIIIDHKIQYMWDCDSDNYKKHKKQDLC